MSPLTRLILAVLALSALPAVAAAQTQLSDAELAQQVGGLRTPTGVDFNFGAVIRTYVDGDLALQSHLTWTDQGAVETVDTGAATANLSAQAAAAGIHIPGGVTTGTLIPGDNGATVVLHDLASDRVASLVLNTADNRNIRQDTAITLDLPNMTQYQSDTIHQQMQMNLQDAVGRALESATH